MHKFLCVLMMVALMPAGAQAADWTAVKLRGLVFANNVAGDGAWVRLKRGDIVDDARVIRTLGNGNVAFQSGDETIAFGPQTQAEIIDRAGRRFTTVAQQAGAVAVSAEARKVQHFSVETPYLVAVVKGTVFSVTTGARGSGVSVSRGLVAVTDRRSRSQVLLPAGRSIVVPADGPAVVSGQVVPALVHPIVNGVIEDADAAAEAAAATPGGSAVGVQGEPDVAGYGIGAAIGDIDGDLGQATGLVAGTAGNTVGGIGSTVGGLGQATGAIGTALGSTVGAIGNGGLGAVTGSVGSTLGTATTTVGNTVSGVGAAVTGVGGTVSSVGASSGGVVGGVTGAVGGVLGHLGL